MSRDIPNAIDTPNEIIGTLVILLSLGAVFGGLYLWENPNLEDRVYALTHESPEFSGESIVFKNSYDGVDTKASINKVYSDTDTEYGWCMRVQENTVENFEHFQGLNETTPKQIRFSCDSMKHNAIMHTHPDGEDYRGITALSDKDEEGLRQLEWIDVSCVVGGEIEVNEGSVEGIGCWTYQNGEVQELDIKFS